MNKKIIGAILCVSIFIIGAMPAMGIDVPSEAESDSNDLKLVRDDDFNIFNDDEFHMSDPDFADIAKPNLTINILPGLHHGIKFEIKNIGDASATDVNWTLEVTTRRQFLPRIFINESGEISTIKNGTLKTVHKKGKRGFCRISVKVTVEADGIEKFSKTANGIIILGFTRLRRFF